MLGKSMTHSNSSRCSCTVKIILDIIPNKLQISVLDTIEVDFFIHVISFISISPIGMVLSWVNHDHHEPLAFSRRDGGGKNTIPLNLCPGLKVTCIMWWEHVPWPYLAGSYFPEQFLFSGVGVCVDFASWVRCLCLLLAREKEKEEMKRTLGTDHKHCGSGLSRIWFLPRRKAGQQWQPPL